MFLINMTVEFLRISDELSGRDNSLFKKNILGNEDTFSSRYSGNNFPENVLKKCLTAEGRCNGK